MTDVTVIIATHDRPDMLEVCVYSILASAAMVKPKGIATRVLVVDDCSHTMAAKDVARRARVDYLRLDANAGIAATLVAGFEASDSPFTSFWGDDDFMLPRYLPLHMAKTAEGYDIVSGSYWLADADLGQVRETVLRSVSMNDLLAGRVAANDGSLLRRSALSGLSWRVDRERAMMMTMWLALAARRARFATIAEPTWLYRRHAGNMSAVRKRDEHDMALRRAAIEEYRAVRA